MTRTNKEGKAREKEVLIMKKIEEKVIQNVLEVRKRSQEAKRSGGKFDSFSSRKILT